MSARNINRVERLERMTSGADRLPGRCVIVPPSETEAEAYFLRYGEPLTDETPDFYALTFVHLVAAGGVPHEN